MSDGTSDGESYDENISPLRRVQKLLHTSTKCKPRKKKKMPPELKIIKAPVSLNVLLIKCHNYQITKIYIFTDK